MLDDFREQASSSPLFEEAELEKEDSKGYRTASRRGNFLGMTPPQRLIIAVMLLALACILSIFCLLVTQRVVPPFLF